MSVEPSAINSIPIKHFRFAMLQAGAGSDIHWRIGFDKQSSAPKANSENKPNKFSRARERNLFPLRDHRAAATVAD
jgi:hypothetical protein